jgi:hypothetical protein
LLSGFTEDDHMPQTFRLVALAVALCTSVASAAEPACMAETYTTVCRDGARELRIIRNTISPSGQYGVAWEVPADGTAEDWVRGGETDGSKLAGDYDGYRRKGGRLNNLLVRLADGKAIRKLAGDYIGDHPFYNHREVEVTWSPDSRYVAILNQDKWTTDVSDMYFVSDGTASEPVSLVSICKRVTKAEVNKRRRKGPAPYAAAASVSSVGNDGTVTALCDREQIKNDHFDMGISVRLTPEGNRLRAQVTASRLCGEDDERDVCAAPPSRD